MEKGTEALAAAAEAVDHKEPEAIPLSELDLAVIRATQGPMPVIEEPYAPAAERLGLQQIGALFEGGEVRLLGRDGNPLPVPVTATEREQDGARMLGDPGGKDGGPGRVRPVRGERAYAGDAPRTFGSSR